MGLAQGALSGLGAFAVGTKEGVVGVDACEPGGVEGEGAVAAWGGAGGLFEGVLLGLRQATVTERGRLVGFGGVSQTAAAGFCGGGGVGAVDVEFDGAVCAGAKVEFFEVEVVTFSVVGEGVEPVEGKALFVVGGTENAAFGEAVVVAVAEAAVEVFEVGVEAEKGVAVDVEGNIVAFAEADDEGVVVGDEVAVVVGVPDAVPIALVVGGLLRRRDAAALVVDGAGVDGGHTVVVAFPVFGVFCESHGEACSVVKVGGAAGAGVGASAE